MKVSLFVPSSSGRAWKLIIDSIVNDGLWLEVLAVLDG